MRKLLLQIIVVCGTVLFFAPRSVEAATVRGLAVHANGAPAFGYSVTVYNQQLGRSAPTVVQANGIYTLMNVPAGAYYLEIWAPGYSQPFVYPIGISEPLTDLPVARVP